MHSGISCCSQEHLIECLTYLWDFRSTEGTCEFPDLSPPDSWGESFEESPERLTRFAPPRSPFFLEPICVEADVYLRRVSSNPMTEDQIEMMDPLWGPSRCLSFKDWFSWWEDGASWGDFAHQFNDCQDRGVLKTSFLAGEW